MKYYYSSKNLCNCVLVLIIIIIIIILQVIKSEGASCHPDDMKVLLQIKDHFKGVYPFSGWNPKLSDDCCNWDVLSCKDHDDENENSYSNGRITEFYLSGMYDDNAATKVSGEIPRLIGDLPYLQMLGFDYLPNLTGSIPSTLTKLSNLETIEFDHVNLTGPIPEFLGQIKSLQSIQFLNSGFSGTIPSSLSLLLNLQVLILSGLNLSGSIPESFGSFKSTLEILRLDTNGLSGPIPKSLGQVNINELELSRNQFTGDASFLFTSDKPLVRVILRENHFNFNFSHVDLPWGLNYIDLSYNEIYGSLPRQLGQLRQLRYVNFRSNQLCGKFPKGRRLKQFSPVGFTDNKCLCDAPGLPPCNK